IPALGLAVLLSLIVAGCDLGGNDEQQPMPPPKPTQPGQPGQPGQPEQPEPGQPGQPEPGQPGQPGQPEPGQPGQPGQSAPPTYPPPGEPDGDPSELPINDMDLEKAAAAYVVIVENERKMQESMEQTEDDAAKQDLQTAADQRMLQAIRNAGLTVEMYNNILRLVRTNEALRERFQEKVQRLQ
ncbi:MAG: DUF4168 domain-containing protein, partial [Thermodesulfobacteriota bacterium]